jgi:nitrogen fixation/metabolism regulation signal transduction histidine kinase
MIERTSRIMARDRRRLATLNNLSAWQEAARRHAHEMRTPLTGARLEIEKMRDLARGDTESNADALEDAAVGALEELDRLGEFTHRFTTFARLPRPKLTPVDLASALRRFVDSYATAWPNLRITLDAQPGHDVLMDEDMLRQVLSNLCDNSSRALGTERGTVTLKVIRGRDGVFLDVVDDGPGVDGAVRDRLFEPYTTTRTIGNGMGLGLAISKKILLEHGGDLDLAATSQGGTTMRLTFPLPTAQDGTP